MTVQSGQSLREQTDFDFIVRQCLVSSENSACYSAIRHNTLSNGDVNHSMSVCHMTVPGRVS